MIPTFYVLDSIEFIVGSMSSSELICFLVIVVTLSLAFISKVFVIFFLNSATVITLASALFGAS